jgi:hypothetical protein
MRPAELCIDYQTFHQRRRDFNNLIAERSRPKAMSATKTPALTDSCAHRWSAQSSSMNDAEAHNTPPGK